MPSDPRPPGCNPVPAGPDEWDEIFRQLEEEIARAKEAGAAGRPLGPVPRCRMDGHTEA